MTLTSLSVPTADFVTSSLSGALTAGATSGTIGTGLNLPATNGVLAIDYDSSAAVGVTNGPEVITYTTYTSGTGAIAGLTRGAAGTTGVSHLNGASVQSAPTSLLFNNLAGIVGNTAWTAWTPSLYKSDSTTTVAGTVRIARYIQLGKRVICTINIESAADPSGTQIFFTLPITANSLGYTRVCGYSYIVQDATAASGFIQISASGTTKACCGRETGNFGTSNSFIGTLEYEAA